MSTIEKFWNLIRYLILILIICNIPSFLLAYFGSSLGSISSYSSSFLLLFFFAFTKEKHRFFFPFILLGLLYFMIGALNYDGLFAKDLLKEFVRFMIVVVCGGEILSRTNKKEIYYVLILGAASIVVNAFIFPFANINFTPTYGRYSGFFLNPNFAGSICVIGFALSYSINKRFLKIGGQLLFTLAGILTFSRGFIVIWLVVNIISIYNDRKNLTVPLVGVVTLIMVFALSTVLSLNQDRLSALKSIFESDTQIQTKTITEDSRTATWALYTDLILDKPFFGHGYGKMKQKSAYLPGVHNSFLLVFGEAGIIPFLLMIGIYAFLIINSLRLFKPNPEYLYLSSALILSAMVGHSYFDNFYMVFLSMFVYLKVKKKIPTT